ncbi:unnamed protein product [Ceutorhynchus assimilis]|uniref:Cytokine-like nuclear factor N-PAC n=1 Tax=Ceutorhynchus assimilis TaxID=467358 RepID=A0A9N9MUW4_9CUCU|nr:unnamed protein product [Ceutorhynchus assimilis]
MPEKMDLVFKEYDFVWAKFMNFNHWPAIIIKPDQNVIEKVSKDSQWVYFLEDHNYAWVPEKNIKPYEEFRARFKNKKVEKAMNEMEGYIREKALDPNYKIPISKFVGKKSASAKKNTQVNRKRGRKSLTSDNEEASAPPAKTRYYADSDSDTSQTDDSQEDANTSDGSGYIGFFVGHINAEYFLAKLINANIKINVWFENKKWAEELEYLQDYAKGKEVFYRVCSTPQLAIANSKATFSCLSNPEQAKSVVNELMIADKNHGFLKGRAYIEMTSIVSDLSKEICSLIRGREGLYLEAMIQGNRDTSIQILAAGTLSVFEFCKPCFRVMGEPNNLGEEVGLATDFHMAFQMLRGNLLVSMTEGLALANQTGYSLKQMRSVFQMTNISCDYFDSKITSMIEKSYDQVNEPVQNLQKDFSQSLRVFDKLLHPTPLTANANEIMKQTCNWGYGELDTSTIYQILRY